MDAAMAVGIYGNSMAIAWDDTPKRLFSALSCAHMIQLGGRNNGADKSDMV